MNPVTTFEYAWRVTQVAKLEGFGQTERSENIRGPVDKN